jgi:hypothetical protein
MEFDVVPEVVAEVVAVEVGTTTEEVEAPRAWVGGAGRAAEREPGIGSLLLTCAVIGTRDDGRAETT